MCDADKTHNGGYIIHGTRHAGAVCTCLGVRTKSPPDKIPPPGVILSYRDFGGILSAGDFVRGDFVQGEFCPGFTCLMGFCIT